MVLTVDKYAQRWRVSCSVIRKGQFLPYCAERKKIKQWNIRMQTCWCFSAMTTKVKSLVFCTGPAATSLTEGLEPSVWKVCNINTATQEILITWTNPCCLWCCWPDQHWRRDYVTHSPLNCVFHTHKKILSLQVTLIYSNIHVYCFHNIT